MKYVKLVIAAALCCAMSTPAYAADLAAGDVASMVAAEKAAQDAAQKSSLAKVRASAVKQVKSWVKEYKPTMSAKRLSAMKSALAQIRAAKTRAKVSAGLEKARSQVAAVKPLHRVKAKAVKKAERAYSAHAGYMDAQEQGGYRGLVRRMGLSKSAAGLSSLLSSAERYVDRAELCRHVNAHGWDAGKVSYVSEWGARNNAYLNGTPMAGTGYLIAKSAHDTNMDPRICSAISYVESRCGVAPYGCAYNVWGWVWNPPAMYSWEDAIDKWHGYFSDYWGGERYPLQSMHGYGGYGPWHVNEQMAMI